MYIHTIKYLRISPKKLAIFSKPLVGMPVERAIEYLVVQKTKAANVLLAGIKSAKNNAEQENKSLDKHNIVAVSCNKGPTFKRHFMRARGRTTPKIKPTTHVRILFDKPKKKPKKQKNSHGS